MRDHGGNIDWAIQRFGGRTQDWIDLSTGINRCPYPVPPLEADHWRALPTRAVLETLCEAARTAYHSRAPILATAGAQAAIQMIPRLSVPGRARVLSPTYNEHAAALRACAWAVEDVATLADLAGADLAVVVNPNNPDGQPHDPEVLLSLVPKVGRLVVDESFADPYPELSVAAFAGQPGLLVLRSFGKFYGLAGVRLGFVFGCEDDVAALRVQSGPWPVSGAAIQIGRTALLDRDWAVETTLRLNDDARRLDALALDAGWTLAGGTNLFRLYETGDARAAQDQLARAHIWTRAFPWSEGWLRLGMPGSEAEWERLSSALQVR
ncbi:MAG: threonine-phosphate decarboxylase [Hyphomicrobium sp.]|nr:threonine-phosphate decarboxylase [Hyphomicrobium sp.]